MKKKIIVIFLTALLVFSLSACGKSKINDTNTRIAENIVNTVDNYLDGYIDSETALNTINTEKDLIDEDDPNNAEQLTLSMIALSLSVEFSTMDWNGSADIESIEENRDKLAELAGLGKRK